MTCRTDGVGGAQEQAVEQAEPGNAEGREKINFLEDGRERQYRRAPKRPEAIEAKKIVADVKAAAREHTQDALDTLKAVMSDAKRRRRPA